MEFIDWFILGGTLLFIVAWGTYKTRSAKGITDYLQGGKKARWHTVGLSVMATQASAITFLSTPGQAYHDGMGFVQFYFGLPLAMIVICLVFIPLYYKLNVITAYEFLERRFNVQTRSLTALLFLAQRGLAAGLTIFAPSIILSAVIGWDLRTLNVIIGILVIIYTVSGGTKAVNITQKQQMFVIFAGMITVFWCILAWLPEDMDFGKSMHLAAISGKMKILDFSFDPQERYTFWSGITGGFFLALSYFGTDQSQVQRYLSGQSVKESQWGLIFNGLLKVPMQFFILLTGVLVFVFYQFNPTPLNFNPAAVEAVQQSSGANDFNRLEENSAALFSEKQKLYKTFSHSLDNKDALVQQQTAKQIKALNLRETELRQEAREVIRQAVPQANTNDKDYVFIHFVLRQLPNGLIGLLLAVILSAAMSSTASELNALGTVTTVDLYQRFTKKEKTEKHFLLASKGFTLMWGILAIIFASYATLFDNLIQLINIIGSLFYGNVLGIFLTAFFIKFVRGRAVFWAAITTQLLIFIIYYGSLVSDVEIGYLWLNAIGCGLVVFFAFLFQLISRRNTNLAKGDV